MLELMLLGVVLAGPPDAVLRPPADTVKMSPRVKTPARVDRAPAADLRTGVRFRSPWGSRFQARGEVVAVSAGGIRVRTERGVADIQLGAAPSVREGERVEVSRTPILSDQRMGYRLEVRAGDRTVVSAGVAPAAAVDLGGGAALRQLSASREAGRAGVFGQLFTVPVKLVWPGGEADLVIGEATIVQTGRQTFRVLVAESGTFELPEQPTAPVEAWGPWIVYSAIAVGGAPGRAPR
jgi:hypothetical protein